MNQPPAAPESDLQLEVVGLTDVGRHRERNEDWWGQPPAKHRTLSASHGFLVAVADGMGGHAHGEIASHLAVDILFDTYYAEPAADHEQALLKAVELANAAIFTQSQLRQTSMGTTLVAALLYDASMILVNIGDSRAYRLRGGTVRQLTRDHSLVAEQVRRGLLSEEEARHSPVRNVLTRSLGPRPSPEPDLTETSIAPGDVILLCSDGLHGLVAPEEFVPIIEGNDLTTAAQALIDLANARGGIDNITCVLVRVVAAGAPAAPDEAAELTPAPAEGAMSDEVEGSAAADEPAPVVSPAAVDQPEADAAPAEPEPGRPPAG